MTPFRKPHQRTRPAWVRSNHAIREPREIPAHKRQYVVPGTDSYVPLCLTNSVSDEPETAHRGFEGLGFTDLPNDVEDFEGVGF